MPEPLDPAALDEILAMAGGDRSFVAAVVEEYLRDSAAIVADLRTAEGSDRQRLAHTLKSTSASVGALQLAAVCKELEHGGDPALVAAVEREHAAATAALEQVMA
jgi:HPt (histidine-containing phosphotransfer) domain-containing protein